MDTEKFEVVAAYFDRIDRETLFVYHHGIKTNGGAYFVVSPHRSLVCLDQLVEGHIVLPSEWSFDGGHGDGRVPNILNSRYGMPSSGSEIDPLFAAIGVRHTERLQEQDLVHNVRLVHGDFNSDETFRMLGIDFRDIQTFYHFQNSPQMLAGRIARRSPQGTVFLVACHAQSHVEYNGLQHLMVLALDTSSKWAKYLHVYQKNQPTCYNIPDVLV